MGGLSRNGQLTTAISLLQGLAVALIRHVWVGRVSVWPAERFARLERRGGATVTGSNGQAGIYDDFPGYRLPPDDELNEALLAALVVIDANVLLNLYRTTSQHVTICLRCFKRSATACGFPIRS
jgi:hypothetical protein